MGLVVALKYKKIIECINSLYSPINYSNHSECIKKEPLNDFGNSYAEWEQQQIANEIQKQISLAMQTMGDSSAKQNEKCYHRKSSLQRKWLLIFLAISFTFCTFFTPWKVLIQTNPFVYSFLGYSPIFSEVKGRSRDFRRIDSQRLLLIEIIIAISCAAGYIYQNKKD